MSRVLFIALALASLPTWAQDQAQAGAQTPEPEPAARKREVYVRRFSAGVSVSANLPAPTRNESLDQLFTTTPVLEIKSNNSPKSSLAGFGLVLQAALTEKWAVAATPSARLGIRMEATKIQLIGSDNVNTIQDDREGTNFSVKTRARFYDLPILARRYSKSRHERGHRWFFEAGPRMRYAANVHTTTEVQPPPGKGDSYTLNDRVKYRNRIFGATGGIGLQFIDDFGIRFVPEVRYTRWLGSTFGDVTGRSRRDQVEIVFSLSF